MSIEIGNMENIEVNNNLILKIDNREGKLKSMFVNQNIDKISILYENLELGDFIFIVDDIELIIIERKSIQDLTSSLRDTRYHNQKMNLMNTYERSRIYYIIEGEFDYDSNNNINNFNSISKDSIISCIVNTMIRDNIKVFQTKDINDTYNLLINIAKKLIKEPKKYINNSIPNEKKEFEIKKSSNINKENCFKYQLMQIPSISLKSADAIIEIYPSMIKFYSELFDKTNEERVEILSKITTKTTNGDKRKLSKKSVKNIIDLMLD